MGRESFERSLFCLRMKIGRRRNRRQYGDIALAAPMRQRQMRITMCCVAMLLDIVKRNESHLSLFEKSSSKVGLVFLSFLNCFVRSGRGRASVVVVCWLYAWVCCERGERRRWRERSEQRVDRARPSFAVLCRPRASQM